MMYGDLRDLKWVDDRMQRLFDKMGRATPQARFLETQYNLKLIAFGDVFRGEHPNLTEEEMLKLPLDTPLGVETAIALKSLNEWIISELKLALMPLS